MSARLAEDFARIEAAYASALAHPLSSRKALLVAVLIENFADQAFEALRHSAPERVYAAEDVLAFRRLLLQEAPALGLLSELGSGRADAPRLETRSVEVPIADYPGLPVADYMVSLYNRNTVPRVLIVGPDGGARPAHEVLGEALAFWRERLG